MKKTYTIDKIPSFRYELDFPTGLSGMFKDKGKADIYLFGKWVGWDNIYHKEEPNFVDSIEKFFSFLNYRTYYSSSDLERLDTFNKSPLARKMFEHLGGWTFKFEDCIPNSDTLIVRGNEPKYNYKYHFELIPIYRYEPKTGARYLSHYNYEFYTNSTSPGASANERKVISAREGLDMIALIRLSFRLMIFNYKEQHSSEIRVFSGWHNYKENLIDLCIQNNLI